MVGAGDGEVKKEGKHKLKIATGQTRDEGE